MRHAFADVCAGWPSSEDIRVIADEGGELTAASEQALYRVARRLDKLESKLDPVTIASAPVEIPTNHILGIDCSAPHGTMLRALRQIETDVLPQLLEDPSVWQTLDIDYEPPRVERLWTQLGGSRLYLHRIHACGPGEALYHPHPWPSAVRLVLGGYEMAIGYGAEGTSPPFAAMLMMHQGSSYEMLSPLGWHYVRPLTGTSLSVMLAGKPFAGDAGKGAKPVLNPLSENVKHDLLDQFALFYPRSA